MSAVAQEETGSAAGGEAVTSIEQTAPTATATRIRPKPPTPKRPQWWNVVLLNDDDHTYEYVIRMLGTLFAHPTEKAFKVAETVHKDGRAVCLTTHKEHAELKRDQVLGFGRDPLSANCQGSMTAIIEPAEFGDDSDEPGNGEPPRGK